MMRLGLLQFDAPLFLAPLSGITDYPFRQLVREMGCDLPFTEMVSAEGLLRKRESFLKMGEGEHPVSVQLFGAEPEILAEAARITEGAGADVIDINMGCPAKQVVKTGSGADLMRFPEKVKKILTEVRKKIQCPLTIKIRSGWDGDHINALEISKIAEGCGVDSITVHPRTKEQGYRGRADWKLIREVKKAVGISVIGNGDVTTRALAGKMFDETGCDGVMIGRGVLGNPWIFSSIDAEDREEPPVPSLDERQKMIHYHFSLVQSHYGERRAVKKFRKHAYWYTKGLPGCASFHSKLSELKEENSLFDTVHSFFDLLQRRTARPSPVSVEGGVR